MPEILYKISNRQIKCGTDHLYNSFIYFYTYCIYNYKRFLDKFWLVIYNLLWDKRIYLFLFKDLLEFLRKKIFFKIYFYSLACPYYIKIMLMTKFQALESNNYVLMEYIEIIKNRHHIDFDEYSFNQRKSLW